MGDMAQAQGTGFLVALGKSNALIVTNYHVIWGAKEVVVEQADGRASRASVVGADRDLDLVLLRADSRIGLLHSDSMRRSAFGQVTGSFPWGTRLACSPP